MLNRALRQTYPPGSTYKVVTAAAGLESGKYDLDKATDTPDPYRLPDSSTDLGNDGDIPCKNATVRTALRYSCNTVFAKMSNALGNGEDDRDGGEVRLQRQGAGHSRAGGRERLPRGQQAAERHGGHRPGEQPGHPAPDGDGRRPRSPTTAR